MSSVNKIHLIGRVGQDPEVKTLQSGNKVATFSLATSEKYTKQNGEKVENTDWHHIEIVLKLNTISGGKGVADGLIQYWYDNELVMNFNHVMFRTGQHPNMKFNQILIAPYVKNSPIEQTFWVDDLMIAK